MEELVTARGEPPGRMGKRWRASHSQAFHAHLLKLWTEKEAGPSTCSFPAMPRLAESESCPGCTPCRYPTV
jgi:hypothetical protein